MPGHPRVKRNARPKRKFTKHTYKKAKPSLLKDFEGRCAYSLQHVQKIGWTTMEVDHHNPTLSEQQRHRYENLFPAIRHCNGAKSDTWPSKWARSKGVRFLNPCKEADYGAQIFEDPETHLLVGTTPAAVYHIRVLSLNADFLVNERHERALLRKLLNETAFTSKALTPGSLLEAIAKLRSQVALMIPPIPAGP